MVAKDVGDRFSSAAELVECVRELRRARAPRPSVRKALNRVLFLYHKLNNDLSAPRRRSLSLAMCVVVALALASYLSGESEGTEHVGGDAAAERKLDQYLLLARESLDAGKLRAPERDNAYFYYQEVLKLAPGHEEGRRGLTDVADRYADLAQQELAEFDYLTSRHYVKLGLEVQPDNARLIALRDETDVLKSAPKRILGGIRSILDRNGTSETPAPEDALRPR